VNDPQLFQLAQASSTNLGRQIGSMATTEKTVATSSVLFGGSCACGRITYESTVCNRDAPLLNYRLIYMLLQAMPTSAQMCHCVTCRKIGGGVFQAFPDVPSKEVTFYDRKDHLRYEGLPRDSIGGITFLRLMAGAERAFCIDCHSELAMRYMHDPETVGVTIGTIDEHTIRDEDVKAALKPKSHIFASQNPWWFDITMDGLPLRDRFGGDYEERMNAWVDKNLK
jgi:hypothetical protein